MKLKVIVPKSLAFEPNRLLRAVERGLDAAAKGVKVDFGVTTQTWKRKPKFAIEKESLSRIVSTDDEIYGYVDRGTRPHIIRPRKGRVLSWVGANYRPKTRVARIGSTKGGNDNTIVYARQVQHPGTEPRYFSITIARKWERGPLQDAVQRAIDSEASG